MRSRCSPPTTACARGWIEPASRCTRHSSSARRSAPRCRPVTDAASGNPVVVWVAWPPACGRRFTEQIRALDARVEVIACGYEEDGALRHARTRQDVSNGTRADAVAAMTDVQRDAMARAEVVFGFDVP